jgi:hypothetical protein
VEALRAGLLDLGYVEGKNVVIDFRWAEVVDRLRELAAELVRENVDVTFATSSTEVEVARQATTTIPSVLHPFRSRRHRSCVKPRAARRQHHRVGGATNRVHRQGIGDADASRATRKKDRSALESYPAAS